MDNNWNIPKDYKIIYSRGLRGKHINTLEKENYVARLSETFSSLNEETYRNYMHSLLWFEESKERECLQEQSVECVRLKARYICGLLKTSKFTILVPGLERKQRYIRTDDALLLISRLDSTVLYGYIDDINVKNNILSIRVKRPRNFMIRIDEEFKLVFLFSNHQYISMHKAVNNIVGGPDHMKIFPNITVKCNNRKSIITWFNPNIASNAEQRTAVEHIVAKSSGQAPYILHGPPGTGKTATIVEAILQVLKMDPKHKVMVCAPSNSAADDVAVKLIKHEALNSVEVLLRRNSSKRDWSSLPKILNKYSKDPFKRAPNTPYDVHIKEALTFRVIVSTISYAPYAVQELRSCFFTHLFIDEAAQATEPQCLVPIQKLLVTNGLLVLSGDPLQLGPVLSSPHAKEHGLGTSLMERLMTDSPYNSIDSDPNYTVMLKNNYRSHRDILHIPNKQFYNGHLKACATEDYISRKNILNERKNCRAIAFHAVYGQEEQEKQSSSYFNKMELDMLIFYILKLIHKRKQKAEDIGIITPYTAQVDKIKQRLDKKGLNEIEVGSVECYQGREKKIILISTVRGQGANANKKVKLGFLVDPKRFNVALTRAKSKLIVIGNPHCLKIDKLWRIYIETCKKIDSYDDKDVSYYLKEEKLLKETTSRLRKMKI